MSKRTIALVAITLLFSSCVLASTGSAKPCRFAPLFKTYDLYTNATLRREFLMDIVAREAIFCKTIGLDQATSMTYDGHRLDVDTGLPHGKPHLFSAPSKESLHVAVLARVLDGHPLARNMYTVEEALDVLRKKVASFEKFHERFPGFGGFMPWVAFDGLGNVTPSWDWQNRVPALDNGELFWAAFATARVLKEKYPHEEDLARRWESVWRNMTETVLPIFYAGNGTLGTVTNIRNQLWPVSNNTYTVTGSLNDPYEGELVTVMVYLFTNLSAAEKHQLWVNKRHMLQRVFLKDVPAAHKGTAIAVQRGFWFSAHEQWKYLMLPYRLSKNNERVFLNGERARSWFGHSMRPSPGLWASVNGPVPTNNVSFPYFSDCGIGRISFNNCTHDDVITPYGSFPLFLASEAHGVAWYHHTILARKGQNCYGTTESFNVSGTDVAPLTTWDSKITTVVAALGGVVDINTRALRDMGLLSAFVDVVEVEWGRVFGNATRGDPLPGEHLPFMPPPQVTIPTTFLEDFTTCSPSSETSACPYNP